MVVTILRTEQVWCLLCLQNAHYTGTVPLPLSHSLHQSSIFFWLTKCTHLESMSRAKLTLLAYLLGATCQSFQQLMTNIFSCCFLSFFNFFATASFPQSERTSDSGVSKSAAACVTPVQNAASITLNQRAISYPLANAGSSNVWGGGFF